MRIRELPLINLFYRNREVIRLAIPVFIELIWGVGINYINQFMFSGVPEATNAIGQVRALELLEDLIGINKYRA